MQVSFSGGGGGGMRQLIKRLYLWSLSAEIARPVWRSMARRKLRRFRPPYKLHLGCGSVRFDNWINVDLSWRNQAVDIPWDLTTKLPLEDGCCEMMYCEHVLEHFAVEQGVNFLGDCRRVLQSGGVLRLAMPSLDAILEKAVRPDWRDQDWLTWPEYQFIQTRAEMLNICFSSWGHKWLYDREELHRRLREAGFTSWEDVAWGTSRIPELMNRETRKDSLLICEARK